MRSSHTTVLLLFVALAYVSAKPLSEILDGKTDELTRVYHVELDPDRGGSCARNGWWPRVQIAYKEALMAIDESRQALQDLKAPMPAKNRLTEQNEWKRKAQAFYALFGKDIDQEFGLGPTGRLIESNDYLRTPL